MYTQNKSSDSLFQQMNNACHRHIENNPNLKMGNRADSLNSIWNDPYIKQNYVTPLVSRHGEEYVKTRFKDICNSTINSIYYRETK